MHLIDVPKGVCLERPWVTLIVDQSSEMALGYHLSVATPSAASVLAALRHVILRKPRPSADVPKSIGMDASMWPAYGIPDLLVVNRGTDLTSFGLREACAARGIELLFASPHSPSYKGTIERLGRTINTRLVHSTPETTVGTPTTDLGYSGAEHATITLRDFEQLVVQYITTIHNKTPRRGENGTPE